MTATTATTPPAESARYTRVAVLLHWLIALAIIGQIIGGWYAHELLTSEDMDQRFQGFELTQLHKSFGMTVLALSLARLGWRFLNPPPPMPAGMKGWEIAAAHVTHVAFYAIMIGVPLLGWLYISTEWSVLTDTPLFFASTYFGLFEIPLIPGLSGNEALAGVFYNAHKLIAYATVLLLALHVGAALKHHFVNRDGVLARMVPFLKAPRG